MSLGVDDLANELNSLKENFSKTVDRMIKDAKRQEKIMLRSDKRQQKEYDELQLRLKEVEELSKRFM